MDQAPSDDQREERSVNPLLYAVAVHMSHLPRTANETPLAFTPFAVPAHLLSKIAASPSLCPYPMNCIYDLVPHNIAYLVHLRQWLYSGILNPSVTASQLE